MLYELVNQHHKVHCLLFDYKQRHSQELGWAKYHARRTNCLFTVMDLPQMGGLNEQSWVVPNRNAVFLSVAVNVACQAKADTVTIGCNLDDAEYFPDCRKGFLDSMNSTVKEAGYDVEICAPYLSKRKWEIGAIAREMGVTVNEVWTCYQPTENGPCGRCPACDNLKGAFA